MLHLVVRVVLIVVSRLSTEVVVAWHCVLVVVLLHQVILRHVRWCSHSLVVVCTLIHHTVINSLRVAESMLHFLDKALVLHSTLSNLLRDLVMLQCLCF